MSLDRLYNALDGMTWISRLEKAPKFFQSKRCQFSLGLKDVPTRRAWGVKLRLDTYHAWSTMFPQKCWGTAKQYTHFAIREAARLTAYRPWIQRQYVARLDNFVSVNQITKNLTVPAIDEFQAKIDALITDTPNPPWLAGQLLRWANALATALQGMVEEALRLGLSVATVIKYTVAHAAAYLRHEKRQLLKLLGVSRPFLPTARPAPLVIQPTYGRHTSIQICAPPCP